MNHWTLRKIQQQTEIRMNTDGTTRTILPKTKWLGRTTYLATLIVLAGHWWWGAHEQNALDEQLALLQSMGEPVTALQLAPVEDASVGASDLRAAGKLAANFP